MIELRGKTLVFGDLHIGIKSDSLSRMMVDVHFIEYLLKYIQDKKIDNVIFLGDWFNSREFINTITLSVGFELAALLAKNLKNLVFIMGNHDLESNSYQNVSSVIGYDSIKNVHLIKKPTDGIVNGKYTLFVPWGFSDVDFNVACKFKYIFGHFNLPGSSIRYNKIAVNNLESISENRTQHNDIRTFSDYLDVGGICFSGHIHCRTEQTYHQHRVIFVGSPFELSFGETSSTHGFYVIDKTNNIKFNPTDCDKIPRHIVLKISSCFDENGNLRELSEFKHLTGNIIKKIIDKDLSSVESLALNEMLNALKIFEFAQAEYGALGTYIADGQETQQTETSALTLDSYFDTVIEAIDENTLKAANVTKDELRECFMSYISKLA
jgi:DNA repair exonuclease SbcCD nuclease subunit